MELETLTILADRLPEMRHELDKLIRKAHRYGNPDIAYTVGPIRQEKRKREIAYREVVTFTVNVCDVVITGEAPHIGDFEFLARVEFTEGGNLIDTVPGVTDLDQRFRTTDCTCEHCRKQRTRSDVYVVRNRATGQQVQVGRQCLRDYLGIDDPNRIAQRFQFFRSFRDLEDWDNPHSRFGGYFESIEYLLAITSAAIRVFGWCSKSQAQNSNDPLTPTVDYVHDYVRPHSSLNRYERENVEKIEAILGDEDVRVARDTMMWVRETMGTRSEYEHNLKTLFGADYVSDIKRVGIVISAVAAYHRAMERDLRRTQEINRDRETSNYVGAEGERIRGILVTQEDARVIGSSQFGETVLVRFRDGAGNILTWFTGKSTGLQSGEQTILDGTVKAHKEHKGVKNTQLSRVKLHALTETSVEAAAVTPAAKIETGAVPARATKYEYAEGMTDADKRRMRAAARKARAA